MYTDQEHQKSYIEFLIIMTKWSASKLAVEAGVAPSTLNRLLNDKKHDYLLSAKTLNKVGMATGFAYHRQFDYTNKLTKFPTELKVITEEPEQYLSVPIYDIRASAGDGSLVEDGQPTGFQPYREQEISRLSRANVEDLAVIQVAGDSMWDTLHDGDKVLVDRTVNRIVRDGIYIIAYEGELLVKRCQRDLENGHVIVKSDNKAYDSFRIKDGDQLNVVGRVIWIGRALG